MTNEKLYRICWRNKLAGTNGNKGMFSEADKDIWLKNLNRKEGPAGFEYWAEEIKAEGEPEKLNLDNGREV